ncbi:hypothetical protein MJO28_002744 [Puccinia striiformis f. sp. tritici]|uniref:Uncharacterized protein n=1 Tax=Puccinia striiformis f. sp. tritici TaxID=168172 RepID=A0ACC0ES87_9BASI|nr:hypothetical protein MJO28_002744 [Puccinia striiformis f. sp. tritici]
MVKFQLTDSLAKQVTKTFNSLDQSSLDSLSPENRLVFEKISSLPSLISSNPNVFRDGSKEFESVEGYLWIDHSSLFALSTAAAHTRDHSSNPICSANPFYDLIKTSKLYFKPKPIREKSKELKAILNKIEKEKDQKEYEEMISIKPRTNLTTLKEIISLSTETTETERDKEEWRTIKKSITLIINILFSVFGTIISIFHLLNVSYGYKFDYSILIAFFVGLLVFMVELILYWNFL